MILILLLFIILVVKIIFINILDKEVCIVLIWVYMSIIGNIILEICVFYIKVFVFFIYV